MATFSNPFAQFNSHSSPEQSGDEEVVSLGYLTGIPDIRQIADPQLARAIKGLLKKDSRTRERALEEFDSLITESNIDEVVHLAYIQLYVKLSIDLVPELRLGAHKVLGHLYQLLGKRSSKYLKYSVGPWLAGTFDPDTRVASAATHALEVVFPDSEKRRLVPEKLKQTLIEFVAVVIGKENVYTLSDERYVEPHDALAKYTRLVKTIIDLINWQQWRLADLDASTQSSIWKFCASSSGPLARASLQLAYTRLEEIDALGAEKILGKELVRALRTGGIAAPIDLLRTLTLYSKKYPDMWTENTENVNALGAFIAADATRPANFWPLLFNLAVNVLNLCPDTAPKPLYKGLSKVAPKTAGDAEIEAWGCFLALSSRMGMTSKAFKELIERSKKSMSNVLQTSLAKQLRKPDFQVDIPDHPSIGLLKIFAAATPKYSQALAKLGLTPNELALLVPLDPHISFATPDAIDTEENAEAYAVIASHSSKKVAQDLVDLLLKSGYATTVLNHATNLSKIGVEAEIKLPEPINAELAAAALSAVDKMTSRETAAGALEFLVNSALGGDSLSLKLLVRASKPAEAFINNGLQRSLYDKLAILAPEDSSHVLAQILEATRLNAARISWEELEDMLQVPACAIGIYPLKLPIDSVSIAHANNLDLLKRAAKLIESQSEDDLAKAAVIGNAARSWAYVTEDSAEQELASAWVQDTSLLKVDTERLWELAEKPGWIAFHAGQLLMKSPDLTQFIDRKYFLKPNVRGAVLAQSGVVSGHVWYDNYQLHNDCWYMRDPKVSVPILSDADDVSWAASLYTLSSQDQEIDIDDLVAAFQGPKFVQLAALSVGKLPAVDVNIIIEAASKLGIEKSAFETDVAMAYLRYVQQPQLEESLASYEFQPSCLQLLDSTSTITPWISYYILSRKALAFDIIAAHCRSLASWALYLRCDGSEKLSEVDSLILDYCGKNISIESIELEPPTKVAGYFLFKMATHHGDALRMWYRELRDRQLRKQVDAALKTVILPAILDRLSAAIDPSEGISVNEKTREVRAIREVDEAAVDITITLPEQYPAKPADINLNSIKGVSEAKKRAWMLEARHKITAGDVLGAMKALLSRFDGFLDGVEPCAICYGVLLDNVLPNKSCPNCGNVYHTNCLYKWFHSQPEKLCPMCRNPL